MAQKKSKQQKMKVLNKKQLQWFSLFVVTIALMFIIFVFLYEKPVDKTERYNERLKNAEQAQEILLANDELVNGDSDLEEQLGEEYDTILAIPNGKNDQEIENEYAIARQAIAEIANELKKHDQETAQMGGLVTIDDLKRVDTLPIQDPEVRDTILTNMGATDEQKEAFKR